MTTQIYNAEMVDLLRSNFPDRQRYAKFAYNVNAQWYDFPLNGNDDSDHFNYNTSTYPSTWTEVGAATNTDTESVYGFWYIQANSATTSWKYRRQLSIDIEADTPDNTYNSFHWGPLLYRDGQYTADLTYYLGIYADNAGAINENVFLRTALQWDSSGGTWRSRGERKDGTTQTNGSWFTFSQHPVILPIYIHQSMRYNAAASNDIMRSYIGSVPETFTHTLQMDHTMNVTWGQVWAQVHMSRGAGVSDAIWIGALDRGTDF